MGLPAKLLQTVQFYMLHMLSRCLLLPQLSMALLPSSGQHIRATLHCITWPTAELLVAGCEHILEQLQRVLPLMLATWQPC
jgi:hypothetical protein